jgi:hypothetical protein
MKKYSAKRNNSVRRRTRNRKNINIQRGGGNYLDLKKIYKSLNEEYKDYVPNSEWDSYLIPNELQPRDLLTKLNGDKTIIPFKNEGILISTGTERSLFDLLMVGDKCTGLIIIDINPSVKYYMDWLLYCFKNAKTLKEFNTLRLNDSRVNGSENDEMINQCRICYQTTNMFRKNAPDYITDKCFEDYRYWEKEDLFLKIKEYVEQGAIITITQSIDDLFFIELGTNIELLDSSNISQYKFLKFILKDQKALQNVLITTNVGGECHKSNTQYYLFKYTASNDTIKAFDNIISELKQKFNEYQSKQKTITQKPPIEIEQSLTVLQNISCMINAIYHDSIPIPQTFYLDANFIDVYYKYKTYYDASIITGRSDYAELAKIIAIKNTAIKNTAIKNTEQMNT